jgi:hypothetical protein
MLLLKILCDIIIAYYYMVLLKILCDIITAYYHMVLLKILCDIIIAYYYMIFLLIAGLLLPNTLICIEPRTASHHTIFSSSISPLSQQ